MDNKAEFGKVEFEADIRDIDAGPDFDAAPQDICRIAFVNSTVDPTELMNRITTMKRARITIENIGESRQQ